MNRYPIGLALLSAALFGAATPASKALLEALTPFQLAGLLYLGAAIGVSPLALGRDEPLLPAAGDRRNRLRLLGAVAAGGVVGPLLLLSGLALADAASVALWLNLELVATAVLGVWLFHDHLAREGWLGVALALVAATLLAWGEGSAGLAAGLLVLGACVAWGLDNHLTALIDGITPGQSTFWKGLVAGSVNLGLGLLVAPLTATIPEIAIALGVGALSYGASIVLYITAAQGLGATRAQVLFSSAPFFGVGLSLLLLGERIDARHIGAAALFAGAVALLFVERHAHPHDHPAVEHAHLHRHDDDHHEHSHPDGPPRERHSHPHRHNPMRHTGEHRPDLHHRHAHDAEQGTGKEAQT